MDYGIICYYPIGFIKQWVLNRAGGSPREAKRAPRMGLRGPKGWPRKSKGDPRGCQGMLMNCL